ncbi:MAG: SEC-C domain-containing protein, partial [Kiritimatiellae bacterium]|nr:SEC-C domain-containing protein [Kiritimatiellia bacterium]
DSEKSSGGSAEPSGRPAQSAKTIGDVFASMMSRPQAAAPRAPAPVQGAPAAAPRVQPVVGRNDPCPCGSGKKFKKCCGRNMV